MHGCVEKQRREERRGEEGSGESEDVGNVLSPNTEIIVLRFSNSPALIL